MTNITGNTGGEVRSSGSSREILFRPPTTCYMTNSFPRAHRPKMSTWRICLPENKLPFNNQSKAEAAREPEVHIRHDPSPTIRDDLSKYVVVARLFVEDYKLIWVGNMESVFQAVWPQCWKKLPSLPCKLGFCRIIDYLEIVGIILGHVVIG